MSTTQDNILDTSLLPFDGDFNKQVEELLARVRLTRYEVENLQCLLDDLIHALRYKWPGAQVHPFGSVVTGLGIKTSDVDCYIQLPSRYEYSLQYQNPVKRAKIELNKNMAIFKQTFAITTAKVPILKFVHAPTGFSCDINFSSLSGVRNSKLIAFLLSLDRRALPLAIILKYWSKVFNFTGTNLMPNYGWTMMVIFYLQVTSVLPSVVELQQHTQAQWVEGWNTAFKDDFVYVSDNTQSLYELLGGFFNFYKNFDFAQRVISPYLGYSVKKDVLGDINNVPIEYSLYKENVLREQCEVIKLDTLMCIQDPFDHGRNCSRAVSAKTFSKIRAHLDLVFIMFHERPCDDFLKGMFTTGLPIGRQVPRTGQHKHKNKKALIHKNTTHVQKGKLLKFYAQWQKHKRQQ